MPLALALKNKTSLVVASDTATTAPASAHYSQLMFLPNRCALMVVGNREAVAHAISQVALPKLTNVLGAASLAQLVQAALVLEVVPKLPEMAGRVEIIVAGLDPIRHTEEPGLYYMDSAQDFYLTLVAGDAITAGSTAAAAPLIVGPSYAESGLEQLEALAKECFATTKLRWPDAVGPHLALGRIAPDSVKFETY